jgi:hypothetical protein
MLPNFHNCHTNRAAWPGSESSPGQKLEFTIHPLMPMTPSTEQARDDGGLENQPTINLTRLVDEFVAKEPDQPGDVVARAPAIYKPRASNLTVSGRKKKKKSARSPSQVGSGGKEASWGGRIAVAMVWLVTLGTGGGMAAYHSNPGFRAKFDSLAQRYSPTEGKSLAEKLADPYKESMAHIEARGLSLEEASKAMGADPTRKATPEEEARFEAELAGMSGEESNVAVARNRRMKEKFGGAAGTLDLGKERDALAKAKAEEARPEQ